MPKGTPKLRTCPFCGQDSEYARAGPEWAPHGWNARCKHGHAQSPDMDTKEEAADWWNRRARQRWSKS